MWNALINLVAPEPTEEETLISSLQQGRTDLLDAWMSNKGLDALEAIKAGGEAEMNVLHVSCLYGNEPAVMKLLQYFPMDKPTRGGNTCAHLAAMNGHAKLVEVLLQRGAQVSIKNNKGQTVYDVSQGLQLRQNLMTLVLAEEQKNGTAPVLPGVTRDMMKDQERLKNLPPPPTSFGNPPVSGEPGLGPPPSYPAGPSPYAQLPRQPVSGQGRQIKPDGFVTTVGQPALAAKYGNQTQSRLYNEADISEISAQQPWTAPVAQSMPPINAGSRYVVHAPGFNVAASAHRPMQPTYRAVNPQSSNVKVFNPADFANASSQDQHFDPPIQQTPSMGVSNSSNYVMPHQQNQYPSPAYQPQMSIGSSNGTNMQSQQLGMTSNAGLPEGQEQGFAYGAPASERQGFDQQQI